MAISRRIEQPYRARFDETGPDGRLRASGFLRYAQDLAWVHSEAAGFNRGWYAERGITWLIRAVELQLLEGVGYGERLTVSTEVLGFRRAWARRRSEFNRQGEERTIALAVTDWLLLNGRGAPVRIPVEITQLFAAAGDGLTPLRVPLDDAPADASERRFDVRRSELDPMNHVNNAAYLDYMDEHFAWIGRSSVVRRLPRRYRVEFVAAAEPGTSLAGRAWEDDLGWSYRLDDGDGREIVRARIETDLGAWVGG